MDKAGLTRSMSRKGCSPDNATCEGVFGKLNNEMFYNTDWSDISISEFMDILNDYLGGCQVFCASLKIFYGAIASMIRKS